MASDHFRTLFDWLQSLYKALTSEIVSRENDIDAGKLKAETRITGVIYLLIPRVFILHSMRSVLP